MLPHCIHTASKRELIEHQYTRKTATSAMLQLFCLMTFSKPFLNLFKVYLTDHYIGASWRHAMVLIGSVLLS